MSGNVQHALADVAHRLQSLKAAMAQKEGAGDQDAQQLAAIKALTLDLEALLQPQAAADAQQVVPAPVVSAVESLPAPAMATKPAALPSTPFDQKRAPIQAPPTKAGPTPGQPATTPLAAEVLASMNNLAAATGGSDALPLAPTAAAVDRADNAAAATLSGLLSGLDPLASAPAFPQQQQMAAAGAAPMAPSLASLFQEAQLQAPLQPMHAAAMAAAAAAGPALPVPRRQSSAAPLLLPLPAASQPREQRPCNCKRSMCLKMYCECFAAGGFCAPTCSCLNCSNTPAELGAVLAARDVVLAKNPRAFEVKVTAEDGHKRGCRCKRSKCLKKYCECFHAGARCNPDVCQCEDCRNTEGDAVPMLLLAPSKQHSAWTADASADVLAMFQQPLAAGSGGSQSSGSEAEQGGRAGRRSKARVQQLPPLARLTMPFPFGLPPMPEPAAAQAGLAGNGEQPAFDAEVAAAMLGSLPSSGLFVPLPLPDSADVALHVAPGPAANFAAAAAMAAEQALEESMADAASHPIAAPCAMGAAATPGGPKVASALTSHLSDVAGPADSEMHDTATSPAPHMAIAKLAARRNLAPAVAPTLTGGGQAASSHAGRPPMPSSRVRSRGNPPGGSPLSQGSADENNSCNTAGSQLGTKRPRRAASGGVLGAVAAEAAEWSLDVVSPPLKRANSLPAGFDAAKRCGKVSDRVALLKKALAGETAAMAAAQHKFAAAACGAEPGAADDEPPTAEDADAISALFELSSSVC